jgi:hypothetical protein
MHQEDEDMEGEHESIATPATELAVAAPGRPQPRAPLKALLRI